jgi:hypothetical protein
MTIIEIIQTRIDNLYQDRKFLYMGNDYYEAIDNRINELESLLECVKEKILIITF